MGAKPVHDQYGKEVLKSAFGDDFREAEKESFGEEAGTFKIDGTIGKDIAVEVESRAFKQVRGAIVYLICHKYRKKLLVLIEKYGNAYTAPQCREIFKKLKPNMPVKVIELTGTGHNNKEFLESDKKAVKRAVNEWKQKKN